MVTAKPLGEQNLLLAKSGVASLSLQGCINSSRLGAQVKRMVIQQLVKKVAKCTRECETFLPQWKKGQNSLPYNVLLMLKLIKPFSGFIMQVVPSCIFDF